MKDLAARILTFAFGLLVIISSLSLNSCKDKFSTQAADTVRDTTIRRDTTIKFDTIVVHDTLDRDDSSIWVFRAVGQTTNDLVTCQFSNSNNGFIGGENGVILKTNDGGNTWITESSAPVVSTSSGPGVVYGIFLADATDLFAVGEQRVVDRSNDGGGSWSQMNTSNVPTTDLIRSVCFLNPTTGFVGTTDAYAAPSGSICNTVDGGNTWNLEYTCTTGGVYHIQFISATNGIATGRYGTALWTSDGGTTWNPGTTDQPNANLYRTAFINATTGFATGYIDVTHGVILHTTDAGHSWQTIRSVFYGAQGIATDGDSVITVNGEGGNVSESKDGGATWSDYQVGTNRWIDIQYPSKDRAVMIGIAGQIVTRDR